MSGTDGRPIGSERIGQTPHHEKGAYCYHYRPVAPTAEGRAPRGPRTKPPGRAALGRPRAAAT